jgi:hypothetical protein
MVYFLNDRERGYARATVRLLSPLIATPGDAEPY